MFYDFSTFPPFLALAVFSFDGFSSVTLPTSALPSVRSVGDFEFSLVNMSHRAHNQPHIACIAIGGFVLTILMLFHALPWLRDEEQSPTCV